MISPAPSLPAFSACAPLPPAHIEPMFGAAAERERLPVELLREVARQESGFRPCAVSRAGAMGVMQLMPASARRLGVWNPFDPRESVRFGGAAAEGDADALWRRRGAGAERIQRRARARGRGRRRARDPGNDRICAEDSGGGATGGRALKYRALLHCSNRSLTVAAPCVGKA